MNAPQPDTHTSFEQVYSAAPEENVRRAKEAQHFFCSLASGVRLPKAHGDAAYVIPAESQDDRTADSLPVPLENVLHALLERDPARRSPSAWQDRFTRAAAFSLGDLLRLLKSPRSAIIREETTLPLHRVRELTLSGLIHICRQPGATRRQKLQACAKGIPTINHRFSLNTTENRMLKRYVRLVLDFCELRALVPGMRLSQAEIHLVNTIVRWLRQEEVDEIRPRGPEAPNNVIIGDIHYNRVWKSLNRLGCLDEDLQHDMDTVAVIESCHAFWRLAASLYAFGAEFYQVPVFFDEVNLLISPGAPGGRHINGRFGGKGFTLDWRPGLVTYTEDGDEGEVREWTPENWTIENLCDVRPKGKGSAIPKPGPLQLDLCAPTPWYNDAGGRKPLPFASRAQLWTGERGDMGIPLDLGSADGVFANPADVVLDLASLLSRGGGKSELGKRGAESLRQALPRMIAARLRRWLGLRPFTYLLPDDADDFTLASLRQAISEEFSQAGGIRTLPRSIAAVLGYVEKEQSGHNAFMAVSYSHSTITLTPVIAEPEQAQDTGGQAWTVWVRKPSISLPRKDAIGRAPHTMFFRNAGEGTSPLCKPAPLNDEENKDIDGIMQLQSAVLRVKFKEIPTTGNLLADGARLFDAFEQTHTSPDEVIWKDSLPDLSLVSIENLVVEKESALLTDATISPKQMRAFKVDELLTLPKGQKEYDNFRIKLGSGKIEYYMRLRSPAFPLRQDTPCRLTLSYTCGAIHPYGLVFTPETGTASWHAKAEWLLDKPEHALEVPPPPEIKRSYMSNHGKVNKFAQVGPAVLRYLLAVRKGKVDGSYIRDSETEEELPYVNVDRIYMNGADVLYTPSRWTHGKLREENIHVCNSGYYFEPGTFKLAHYALGALMADHQLNGTPLPAELLELLPRLREKMEEWDVKCICNDFYYNSLASLCLLLFPDNPPENAKTLLGRLFQKSRVRNSSIYFYPMCAGALAPTHMRRLVRSLLSADYRQKTFRQFEHLSRILWQHPHTVLNLSQTEVARIIKSLNQNVEVNEHFSVLCTNQAEIILALLRLRAESSSMRQLFQRNGNYLQLLTAIFEKRCKQLLETGLFSTISSTLSLDIHENIGDIPPLLYAVHHYLTGENPMASIHISTKPAQEKMR